MNACNNRRAHLPRRALLLLLVLLLAVPVWARAEVLDLVGTWDEIGFASQGEERIAPGHPVSWTFRADGTFADDRESDAPLRATWSLEGDRLEILFHAATPFVQTGTVSRNAQGELAFHCRNEMIEGDKRTPEGEAATLFFVRKGKGSAKSDGAVDAGGGGDEPAGSPSLDAFGQGGWIDGKDVNLRAKPSSKGKALGKLRLNDGVDVLEAGPLDTVGTWGTKAWYKVKVRRTGVTGWVFGAFLKPVEGCSN